MAERGYASLPETTDRIVAAGLQGLTSRESVRKAVMVRKTIPSIREEGQTFVLVSVTDAIVETGCLPVVRERARPSDDVALVRYYAESEAHTPIAALAAGKCKSLRRAERVYEAYQADPAVRHAREEKTRGELLARGAEASARLEVPCASCKRTEEEARRDSMAVERAIAGGALDLAAERALHAYASSRCPGCWRWLPGAPVDDMRAALSASRAAADAASPVPEPVSPSADGEPPSRAPDSPGDCAPGTP